MPIMGKLRETASFHRRLKHTEFISKKIPFPNKRVFVNSALERKVKDPCVVEIRNKYTNELVDIEELVGTTQEKRNWKGIVIALLVIVTVFALIVTAIILVLPKVEDEPEGDKIDFQAFIKDEYEPRVFQPIWLPGSESFLFRDKQGGVSEFSCEGNSTKEILDNSIFRELSEKFRLSADKKYALFIHDIQPSRVRDPLPPIDCGPFCHPRDISKIYRHSSIASYTVVNVKSTSDQYKLVGPGGPHFQYVQWSTDGHSLICVQYNDIFYLRDPTGGTFEQLTFDGHEDMDHIFNGIPDWVYEEEILHSDNAIWFSPGGHYILYAAFDDRDVPTYDMTIYGDMENEYVTTKPLPYPKPGTPNPKVKLKIIELETNATQELQVPSEFQNIDHYFTMVSWQNKTHVLVAWMNRAQNLSILSICDATNGKCKKNLRTEGDGGWVDMYRPAVYKPGGSHYFILLPHKDGNAGSFQHIAMVDSNNDLMAKPGDGSKLFLTAGQWDVIDIVGYDDETNIIYFIATKMGDPRMRHLYSTVTLKDSEDYRKVTCVSCDVSEDCQYVDASFTPTGKYYMLGCKGPAVPSYHLYSIDNGFITTLEDNAELKKKMDNMMMPVIEFEEIPINKESDEFMWAKVLLPPILKKKEIITYNILFRVYGAPGTQLVTKEFSIGWDHYMCSLHNIIVVYVDGRGSGGRGNRWLHANYKALGTLEVEDTLTAARYFNSLHYVNEPAAIWGLSYGGFLSSSVIGRGEESFNCGLSIAPVTDWRYYDSVYTERYMGMPTAKDNLGAYNVANISKNASNFKSARFLIIHGTQDDNVHFQNSAQLMKALIEEDVYFQQQIYPDQNHFLNGGNTKRHLYNTMEDFILHCYGKPRNNDEFSNENTEKDIAEDEGE